MIDLAKEISAYRVIWCIPAVDGSVVKQRTIENESITRKSIGRWFISVSKESFFLSLFNNINNISFCNFNKLEISVTYGKLFRVSSSDTPEFKNMRSRIIRGPPIYL